MTDREKVIEGLEVCIPLDEGEKCPTECPYHRDVCAGYSQVMRDALALLKEQEAVVRCKDCRYLNEDSGICVIGIMHGDRDTWFCAYGKRR